MSWRNKAQVFPASVSPTPGSPVCALTTTEARPEWQLSSTDVLGKPVVLEMCLQIAWQISTLCFAEEFQLISFLSSKSDSLPPPYLHIPHLLHTSSVRCSFLPITGLDSIAVKHLKRAEQEKRWAVT